MPAEASPCFAFKKKRRTDRHVVHERFRSVEANGQLRQDSPIGRPSKGQDSIPLGRATSASHLAAATKEEHLALRSCLRSKAACRREGKRLCRISKFRKLRDFGLRMVARKSKITFWVGAHPIFNADRIICTDLVDCGDPVAYAGTITGVGRIANADPHVLRRLCRVRRPHVPHQWHRLIGQRPASPKLARLRRCKLSLIPNPAHYVSDAVMMRRAPRRGRRAGKPPEDLAACKPACWKVLLAFFCERAWSSVWSMCPKSKARNLSPIGLTRGRRQGGGEKQPLAC